MIDVKNNYRNKYRDLVCRGCGKYDETQQHILEECETIHQNKTTQVTTSNIFTEDTEKLKETAKKIKTIITQLHNQTEQNNT